MKTPGNHLSPIRTLAWTMVGALVVTACSRDSLAESTTLTEQTGLALFCAEVVPWFQVEPDGTDDPAGPIDGVTAQMAVVREASTQLSEADRVSLLGLVNALTADLEAARQGRAAKGWSSIPVVNMIGSLCGVEDLIGWIVQP